MRELSQLAVGTVSRSVKHTDESRRGLGQSGQRCLQDGRGQHPSSERAGTTGVIIVGRRTYDLTGGWGGNHPVGDAPVFVVTHSPPKTVPDGPTSFTFVDGVQAAVEQAEHAAGDKDVSVIGGASVARQCLLAGLLDEVQIHLTPVLLGRGIRLIDDLEGNEVSLEQTHVLEAPGVTHLRYHVLK